MTDIMSAQDQRLAALFCMLSNEGRDPKRARDLINHEMNKRGLSYKATGWIERAYKEIVRVPVDDRGEYLAALRRYEGPIKTGGGSARVAWCIRVLDEDMPSVKEDEED